MSLKIVNKILAQTGVNGAHGLAVQQHVVQVRGLDLGNVALNRKSDLEVYLLAPERLIRQNFVIIKIVKVGRSGVNGVPVL